MKIIARLIFILKMYHHPVPQVEIRGAPDIYVMAGSGVALHCVISGLIETPPYIFWYHKTERIAGSALEESRMFEGSKEAAALASSGPYFFFSFFKIKF